MVARFRTWLSAQGRNEGGIIPRAPSYYWRAK